MNTTTTDRELCDNNNSIVAGSARSLARRERALKLAAELAAELTTATAPARRLSLAIRRYVALTMARNATSAIGTRHAHASALELTTEATSALRAAREEADNAGIDFAFAAGIAAPRVHRVVLGSEYEATMDRLLDR
jgi:hypothetical protein